MSKAFDRVRSEGSVYKLGASDNLLKPLRSFLDNRY